MDKGSIFLQIFLWYKSKINELCHQNFDIKGIKPIQFWIYSEGGKYDWHVDQGSKILFKDSGASSKRFIFKYFLSKAGFIKLPG